MEVSNTVDHAQRLLSNENIIRMPGVLCYTPEEFAQTPHGKVSIKDPLYKIYKIHDTLPPTPWPTFKKGLRPLAGIRVLDLTKVVAGPTITRILALLGADVLRISTTTKPDAAFILFDGQMGKRDVELNLKSPEGRATFEGLLKDADVLVDGYRPGVLEKLGFSREWVHELARQRQKGMVYCRENCYGWNGEWSHRAGYQQISDCVSEHNSMTVFRSVSQECYRIFVGLPKLTSTRCREHHGSRENFSGSMNLWYLYFPTQTISEFRAAVKLCQSLIAGRTGIVGAISVCQALMRRTSEGGSFNIDLSLTQFNNWYIRTAGLHDAETKASLRALHPNFNPRHDTELFALIADTMKTTQASNGTGKGQLWDPARWTTGPVRWGKEAETARYLDWRRIVNIDIGSSVDEGIFGFDHGSCMPGSDSPTWL